MKKLIVALMGLSLGVSLNAENAQITGTCEQVPHVAVSQPAHLDLSAEEQAFVAKLNDQNRRVFTEKMTADQRKVAMATAKDSSELNAADEAVAGCESSCASSCKKEHASVAENTSAAK